MNILLATAVMLAASHSVQAQTYGNLNNVEFLYNYDGDTFNVNIDGVHPIIGQSIPIRVAGIDCPEIKGLCQEEIDLAQEAKVFTENLLKSATNIDLINIGRDKYFRIDADVQLTINGQKVNLMTELLSNNLAVKYSPFDESKPNWCTILQNK